MPDLKISELTNYTTPISTDVLPITDVTAVATKKVTVANLTADKAPIASPTFTGTVTTPAIKITTGAGANKVLTSDLDGDATWEAPATSVSVTTKGDVQTYSTTPDRLPVGTNDQVLTADSTTATGLKWAAASGSSGAASVVNSEAVSGTKNGTNTAFTLANTPVSGSVLLYLNGQRLTVTGDYTISGTAITMVTAPVSTDVLLADYLISSGAYATGSASFVSNEVPSGTVNGSNATFTLVSTPVTGTLALYRDGQLMVGGGADYTLTTNSIAFVTAPVTGSVLIAFYQSAASTAGNADLLDGVHLSTITDTALTGWYAISDSWAYASADAPTFTITVPSGAASKYTVGMRVKLTQTTVKYFIITVVADTVLTVYGGTDYTLANAAISAISVSNVKAPLGFPMSPAKWTVRVTDSTDRSQAAAENVWYNLGSVQMSIPIGVWSVTYNVNLQQTTAAVIAVFATLSTANNSESDNEFSTNINSVAAWAGAVVTKTRTVTLAAKTTYYINTRTSSSATPTIYNRNTQASGSILTIEAICSYL